MIKMRRLCFLVLAVALLFGLCACGGNGSGTTGNATAEIEPDVSEPVAPDSSATFPVNPEPTDQEPTTPEPTVTSIDIDIPWTDVTYSVKDGSGYTFDITLHLSPWILLSDTDLINSAWDEVSSGKALPQFDDWGFKHSGSEYWSSLPFYGTRGGSESLAWYMTDMYYSVGTVTIKNTTAGFDITESNSTSVIFPWGYNKRLAWSDGHVQWFAGRILSSNDVVTRINGLYIGASVNSNIWGPVPVILMTSEYISPNTPNGLAEYILSDEFVLYHSGTLGNVLLESENIQVHLGILKSDREYVTQ